MEQKPRGRPRASDVQPLGALAQRFGEGVRRERELQKLSQADLARAVAEALGKKEHEFHPTTLAKVERGTRPTPLDEAAAIARVLGKPLDRLLSDPATTGRRQRRAHEELLAAEAEYEAAVRERKDLTRRMVALGAEAQEIKKREAQARTRLREARARADVLAETEGDDGKPRKKI